MEQTPPKIAKPAWLRRRLATGETYHRMFDLLRQSNLHTVCEEAHCPNLGECFSSGTATFMIMGDRCTRNCRFCAVEHGGMAPLDEAEPESVAKAVRELGLKYAVITSVTRDDLQDGGAGHFARTIRAVLELSPDTRVEVLIPDLQGSEDDLRTVVEARPHVLNHNVETVVRLYPAVRPQADYRRSLELIRRVRGIDPQMFTKSGIMLGLGETEDEVRRTLEDLRQADCLLLTLGQYLAPSEHHHPVVRYVPPEEFARWEEVAYAMGFTGVASGPFVRSSYHASEMVKE